MPFYQKEKSKIRMVVLTKHGHENPVFYSPIQENAKPSSKIIEGMLKRIPKTLKMELVNVIRFYENGALIYEVK